MMDIYVKMEMITNRVLHFHNRKVSFYFRNRKLLNYLMEENSSVGILPIFKLRLECRTSWAQSSGSHYRKLLNYQTEENSSVGILVIFKL